MPGPPPKPTLLKIIEGNPGRRPLNDAEPKPAPGVPECPDWLHPYGVEKWGVLGPDLARMGLLTTADGDTFAAYCSAWAEFRIATETLAKEGRTCFGGSGGLKPHPAVAMQRSAWQTIRAYSALFGLSPSDRSRIKVPPKGDEADELDGFLGKGTA